MPWACRLAMAFRRVMLGSGVDDTRYEDEERDRPHSHDFRSPWNELHGTKV
jgi:hypothetical protein